MNPCKLCHQVLPNSSSDRNMCKKCYSDITKYKRLIVKNKSTPKEQRFMATLEGLFRDNEKNDGYVPKCFYASEDVSRCVTCFEDFKRIALHQFCSKCQAKERAYISLHSSNPRSLKLDDYYSHYVKLHLLGRKVPNLFYERHPSV